jgi:hypothetical protein
VYYSKRVQKCEYALTPAGQKPDAVTSLGRKHVTNRPLRKGPPLLLKAVGALTLDPFETQVKSKLPNSEELLHHCMFSTYPTLPAPVGAYTLLTSPVYRLWMDHWRCPPARPLTKEQSLDTRVVSTCAERPGTVARDATSECLAP